MIDFETFLSSVLCWVATQDIDLRWKISTWANGFANLVRRVYRYDNIRSRKKGRKAAKVQKNIMFSEVDLPHCHKKHYSVLWSDPKILPRSSEQWHSTPNRFYRRRIQPWKPRTDEQCWWNPPSSCSQSCSQMRQRSSRLPTAVLHSLSGSSEYLQFNFLP